MYFKVNDLRFPPSMTTLTYHVYSSVTIANPSGFSKVNFSFQHICKLKLLITFSNNVKLLCEWLLIFPMSDSPLGGVCCPYNWWYTHKKFAQSTLRAEAGYRLQELSHRLTINTLEIVSVTLSGTQRSYSLSDLRNWL